MPAATPMAALQAPLLGTHRSQTHTRNGASVLAADASKRRCGQCTELGCHGRGVQVSVLRISRQAACHASSWQPSNSSSRNNSSSGSVHRRSREVKRTRLLADSFVHERHEQLYLKPAAAASTANASGGSSSNSSGRSAAYTAWDDVTQQLTALSTVAGLFMMVPQILKNAANLSQGNAASLSVLSWLGYATGFMGNMLLLSYFTASREGQACCVQVVGAASTAILLSQIWLAGFMPTPALAAIVGYFTLACSVNALQFCNCLPPHLWSLWEDVVAVVGLTVLSQVIISPLLSPPLLPLPAVFASSLALFIALLRRGSKLPAAVDAIWTKLGGWTATLLFMFMPVAQLQMCFSRPQSLAGISVLSPLLTIAGNGLMIPRALFTRDLIWFTGCTWGTCLMGWGILLAMALNNVVPQAYFALLTIALVSYFSFVCYQDSKAHALTNPFMSFGELIK